MSLFLLLVRLGSFTFNSRDFCTVVCIFPVAQEPLQTLSSLLGHVLQQAGDRFWARGMVGSWVFWGQCTRREERGHDQILYPDFGSWEGTTHCQGGEQESLLLIFISIILIQKILAVGSGSQGLGLRSCLCPHKDPGLPHLLLFTSNQRVHHAIYSSLWISCLGTIWEAKQKVIKQVLETFVLKDSQDICDGLWGLCPLALFYQTTWLCFVFVLCSWVCASSAFLPCSQVHLLHLCKQILHHIYPFPRALKLLFYLIFSNIVKCFFVLAQ